MRGRLHLREQRCKQLESWLCGDDFTHTIYVNVPEVSNMASTAARYCWRKMYKTCYGPLYTRNAIDPCLLPGVCKFSNNWSKVKYGVSLSFYGNTFFCHDGSHQLSRSNIEARVIDPIQHRRREHDLHLLGLAVVGVQDPANKTCFNWRPLFDRNAVMP